MNEGQEKFLNFILKRVKDGNEAAATQLLEDTFNKQDTGAFDSDYMMEFVPKMLSMLKSECIPEVTAIMQDYDPNLSL